MATRRQLTMELTLSLGQFRNSLQMVFLTLSHDTGVGWFSELPDPILYMDYNTQHIEFNI